VFCAKENLVKLDQILALPEATKHTEEHTNDKKDESAAHATNGAVRLFLCVEGSDMSPEDCLGLKKFCSKGDKHLFIQPACEPGDTSLGMSSSSQEKKSLRDHLFPKK